MLFNWLNQNIIALGLISLFSDFSSEMATALLPSLVLSLGGSAALLGIIEGIADASVCFMKLGSGWYSDILGKRKPFVGIGYFLTAAGISFFITAFHWYQILAGRLITRLGKGLRDPARDAWLAESSTSSFYGRVFGFHRAMDTVGAIIGPATAFILIKMLPLHTVFIVALLPTLIVIGIILFFTHEPTRIIKKERPVSFMSNIRMLPPTFRMFLTTATLFSLGKVTATLLILRATELLIPEHGTFAATSITLLLYTLYNICYAVFSLPMGTLADKFGIPTILFGGYLLMGIALLGFMINSSSLIFIGMLFIITGIAIASIDALERSLAASLLPTELLGTGYGALAALQGIGALLSSSLVGILWSMLSPAFGFGYSAIVCLLGALFLYVCFLHSKSAS